MEEASQKKHKCRENKMGQVPTYISLVLSRSSSMDSFLCSLLHYIIAAPINLSLDAYKM